MEISKTVGDDKPTWAGILYTVASAIESNRDSEFASICQIFAATLKMELDEQQLMLHKEQQDISCPDIDIDVDAKETDCFMVNKEGHS